MSLGHVLVALLDYMQAYLAEPELSEEEWLVYQNGLSEVDSLGF